MAILACSRGNRLVASEITVPVGQSGGFNIKAARAAAKDTARLSATGKELMHEATPNGKCGRIGAAGARRRRRECDQGGVANAGFKRGGLNKRGGASSWALAQNNGPNKTSTDQLKRRGFPTGHITRESVGTVGQQHSGDSVAQSSFVYSAGSCVSGGGGSVGGTEGSTLGTLAGDIASTTKTTRGINGDSVVWASSRRTSRSTPSFRGRRVDGPGQGETIRRLVHMGLF